MTETIQQRNLAQKFAAKCGPPDPCIGPGKQPASLPVARHCGLECPTTTLPTCCLPQYPPGSTVLECRLEGDQPVAHVLQVPADPASTTQKTCLLVETKQSPSGPLSRVMAVPQKSKACASRGQVLDRHCSIKSTPISYSLESYDCPEGANAHARIDPVEGDARNSPDMITTVETSEHERNPCGPLSRIVLGTLNDRVLKSRCCEEVNHEPPVTFIECMSCTNGPIARVSQYPKNQGASSCSHRIQNFYETTVPRDGSCPKAGGFQCPVKEKSTSSQCNPDVYETRVSSCGVQASMQTFPRECCAPKYRGYLESKLSDGAYARISQRVSFCAEDECEDAGKDYSLNCCPRKLVLPKQKYIDRKCRSAEFTHRNARPQLERRNGLDPEDEGRDGSTRKAFKQQNQVSPPSIQLPTACPERQTEKCLPREMTRQCRYQPPPRVCIPDALTSDQHNRATKSCPGKLSDCRSQHSPGGSSTEEAKPGKCVPKKAQLGCDSSKFKSTSAYSISRIPSKELIVRYKDYIPINQLLEYEVSRSKRNGLQDEYILPIPLSIVDTRKKETSTRKNDKCTDKLPKDDCDELNITVRVNRESKKVHIPLDCQSNTSESLNAKFTKESAQASPRPGVIDKTNSKLQTSTISAKSEKGVRARKKKALKKVKSRELYGGQVLIDCDCYHRNGLQHDCPRLACGGEPCRIPPWPNCDLGQYFMDKWDDYYDHLDRIPPITFYGTKEEWIKVQKQQYKPLKQVK